MEDILKFLLVIGFLAFGFFKQAKKETASEQKGEGEPIPMPEETCDDPIYEVASDSHMKQKEVQKPKRRKKHPHSPEPPESPKTISTPVSAAPQNETDYSIHSAEEARKAIIWSEILHRKYE